MPGRNIDSRITGIDEVQEYVRELEEEYPDMVEDTIKEAVVYFQSQIPEYPVRPEPSSYRRTGRLGESLTWVGVPNSRWSIYDIKDIGGKVEAVVGTSLPYAIWVIDVDYQAGVHQGIWWIIQEVFEDAIPGIVRVFERRLNEFINRK